MKEIIFKWIQSFCRTALGTCSCPAVVRQAVGVLLRHWPKVKCFLSFHTDLFHVLNLMAPVYINLWDYNYPFSKQVYC